MSKQELTIEALWPRFKLDSAQSYGPVSLSPTSLRLHKSLIQDCVRVVYKTRIRLRVRGDQQQQLQAIIVQEYDKLDFCLAFIVPYPFFQLPVQTLLDGQEVSAAPSRDMSQAEIYEWLNLPILRPPTRGMGRLKVELGPDAATLLGLLLDGLAHRSTRARRNLMLPMRWFSKAASATNPYDRFIAYWISFNAIYESYRKASIGELAAVQNCLAGLVRPRKARSLLHNRRQLFNFMANTGIVHHPPHGKSRPVAAELQAELSRPQPNYQEIIRRAGAVLYAIRCNLFHGDYNLDDPANIDSIRKASKMLFEILRVVFAYRILNKQLPPLTPTRKISFHLSF